MTLDEGPDERMLEWLDSGPSEIPVEMVEAAVEHARTHPRRRLSRAGLRRFVMTQMHLQEVQSSPAPRRRGLALAVAVGVVAVVVVAGGVGLLAGGDGNLPGTGGVPASSSSPSPAPSAAPSPSGEPSPAPSPSLPAPTSIASACTVSTLAGKAGEPGAADGTGSEARFSTEAGFLAWDAGEGVLYLADAGNHAIRKITPEGVVTTVFGKLGEAGNVDGTGTAARFDTPVGIDASLGWLYIADSGNGSVRAVLLADGTVTTHATGLKQPWAIAIRDLWDGPGVVYISELDGDTIWSLYGDNMAHLGGTLGMNTVDGWGAGGWGWPFGMAQAPEPEQASSQVTYIVDVNADRSASALRRFDRSGQTVTTLPFDETFGRAGVPWVDATNTMYLTTFLDGTVVRRDWDGRVTLLAGKRGEEGSADGAGDVARFTGPMGIVGDGAGTLYVADSGNATIRAIRCP